MDWRKTMRDTARRITGTLPTGIVLYQGPSQLDGKPIAAIATGIRRASDNGKTGDMIQVWIVPLAEAPHIAVKTGTDATVCGDCKHRPFLGGGCYVLAHNAPRQVWFSHKQGRYPTPTKKQARDILRGTKVRFGAWGDPAAVPFEVWGNLLPVLKAWTGYTHQWPTLPEQWSAFLMASVDNAGEYFQARAQGWRTFRVMTGMQKQQQGEITCASDSKGRSCADCRLCDGQNTRAKNITIHVHGTRKGRFA
jgi:hypothetical protein